MKFLICLLLILAITSLILAKDENRSEISRAIHENIVQAIIQMIHQNCKCFTNLF